MFATRLLRVRFTVVQPHQSLIFVRPLTTDMAGTNSGVEKIEPVRYDNIVKPQNDKRDYRALILNNKMKVLLISDKETDKSAASLNVGVGFLNDPKDIPGLAHFCEHMLFLGTTKYPNVNEYNQYLSYHGGASNASTYMDHTNYYFDVDPEYLEGSLDRFSQFFVSPLFTESVTEKEITAVHLEHEKNLASDTWRLDQLDKSSANPNHVYCRFGTGNRETLQINPKEKNIDIRQALLDFHSKYYSANIMALSVLGKETLDELETMIMSMFSDVPNKDIELPRWPEHPFTEEHFKHKWSAVPVKDIRNLSVTFPIPDLQEHFRSSPLHYWSHLLGHEGKGSLLSALREKGWCSSLMAGKRSSARGFDFFSVFVDLTEKGIHHTDDIITMIFQYIKMINEEGPVEWVYNEYRDIANLNFRFKEKSQPRNWVKITVSALSEYPIEEVLTGPRLINEWRPDLIKDLSKYFVPEKVRVSVISKHFESIVDSVEPLYGTKYKMEKIPEETIQKWSKVELNKALAMPEKNEFIPSNFAIKPMGQLEKFPVIIEDTPFIRLWYKKDDEFLLPKAVMTFDFVSPLAYMDPLNSNMTYMFVQLFRDSLNEYAYNADLAGIKWELSNSKYGMNLVMSGYDHKLDVLLEKVMERLMNFDYEEERFEILKENYIRNLKNFEAEQPYQHVAYYLAVLLSEQVWVKNELLNATPLLTYERVRQFAPLLMSKMHIESLIHGNFTRDEALRMGKIVENKIISNLPDLTPLLPRQMVLYREIKLPNGSHYVYEINNKHHKSSCTQIFWQTGLQTTESNMKLELLAQIISEPCFNKLRNEQQLGYIVFSGVRRTSGVQGLRCIVQSNRHPQYVDDKIEDFITDIKKLLINMKDEEFSKHVESLATRRLEKPKVMSSQTSIYWNEIGTQQYNFDRMNIEVAYLRTLTKQQIIDFYNTYVWCESEHIQKMSIHVLSTADDNSPTYSSDDPDNTRSLDSPNPVKAKPIVDILSFKTSQTLYPLAKYYTNVPRKGTQKQSKL
ncbi:hypothetical protein TKK_0015787 [Trichogramma kaykai]|uniref:Insulin-degrading enzyme n=1 Tax=Trichogramma kaykai TaxID=54128 RepID=A0ABD2W8D6_9HYME